MSKAFKAYYVILFLALLITNVSRSDHESNKAFTGSSPRKDGALNILFIGNSLTYTNNLPALLEEIARMDNITVTYTTIALPNYSLEDHLAVGLVQREIASGKYDIVIAQQGPSAMPDSRDLLVRDSKKLAKECARAKSKWSLFTVWPAGQRSFDLDKVILSYSEAAKASSGIVCPAGLAWKLAWKEKPDLPLYGPDQFHPSVMGSVLAAMTIYARIREKNDLDFIKPDKVSWKSFIGEEELVILKRCAMLAANSQ